MNSILLIQVYESTMQNLYILRVDGQLDVTIKDEGEKFIKLYMKNLYPKLILEFFTLNFKRIPN